MPFPRRILILFILILPRISQAGILYEIVPDTVHLNKMHIRMELTTPIDDPILGLPNWLPGAYIIADYARHLTTPEVYNSSMEAVPLQQTRSNAWLLSCPKGERLLIQYDLNISPRGFMGKALSESGGRVFAGTALLYLRQHRDLPATVQLHLPADWKSASGLESAGLNRYRAADYDELVDSPIYFGDLEIREQRVRGLLIQSVWQGAPDYDRTRFDRMIRRVVESGIDFFVRVPFRHYMFLFHTTHGSGRGGGLEHRNSASIGLSGQLLADNMEQLSPVIAHEFFHAWNIKSFFPTGFEQPNYDRPLRTTSFWLVEGVTEYYGWLLALRAGLIKPQDWYDKIASEAATLLEQPERLERSLADASWETWEAGYMSTGLSYYNKGFLVGLMLDLTLQQVTAGKRNLDDVMLAFDERYSNTGQGYSDEDIAGLILDQTGVDARPFLEKYIYGTVELPLQETLARVGLELNTESRDENWIGKVTLMGPKHTLFMPGKMTPLGQAGLKTGDQILQINGRDVVDAETILNAVRTASAGDTLQLTINRQGRTDTIKVVVESREDVSAVVKEIGKSRKEVRQARSRWLGI